VELRVGKRRRPIAGILITVASKYLILLKTAKSQSD